MSGCEGGSCSTCGGSDDPDRLPPGMLKMYDVNQSTADGILVFLEAEANGLSDVGAEILGKARSICDGRLFAVVFGGLEIKPLYPEIFGYGVDTLYHVRDKRLETYVPEAYAACVCEVIARIEPAIVLFGATPKGRELAPRVASSLGRGLTADCTDLRTDGRKLTATRPAFGGTLMADIDCVGFPQLATVRPGTFPKPERKEGQGTAIYWQYTGDVLKEIVSDVPLPPSEGGDIRDARILISLGDGIRDRSLIDVAESVARKMGAEVSCSRALVEKGWMPRSRQVGMSGRTVAPDLYIAFGISGAVQHRAGMMGAGKVVAVNRDADAPIHGFADLSLLADAGEVLRALDRSL
ncbi:MAG: electron transfer flavoprotein subunit alpha/FixB family protein [Thermoplasmata archaeon]|nr:electron transfer flavoprotein subunit alpha/FixB family protein [Thermoplasmata archaeon]